MEELDDELKEALFPDILSKFACSVGELQKAIYRSEDCIEEIKKLLTINDNAVLRESILEICVEIQEYIDAIKLLREHGSIR